MKKPESAYLVKWPKDWVRVSPLDDTQTHWRQLPSGDYEIRLTVPVLMPESVVAITGIGGEDSDGQGRD